MSEEKINVQDLDPARKRELADRAKARAIVREILDFGVNDSQLREIIKQLALEIESRDDMLKILELLGSSDEPEQQVKVYT